jgi:hypothetical protein
MMRGSLHEPCYGWATFLLILAVALAIPQTFLMTVFPFHYEHQFDIFPTSFTGEAGHEEIGIYEWLRTSSGVVFILNAWSVPSGNVLFRFRLIFYCQHGTLANQWLRTGGNDQGMFVDLGYEWCKSPSQIPFKNGQRIAAIGTLIKPTEWNALKSTPRIDFYGDLYVFQTADA